MRQRNADLISAIQIADECGLTVESAYYDTDDYLVVKFCDDGDIAGIELSHSALFEVAYGEPVGRPN